jgi:hypothetical protein
MSLAPDDLPIRNYDRQNAGAIAAKLQGFSQNELRAIAEYEAEHECRPTVLERIAELTADEPWPGYDEQDADAIASALAGPHRATARKALDYEREHKARALVIRAAKSASPSVSAGA